MGVGWRRAAIRKSAVQTPTGVELRANLKLKQALFPIPTGRGCRSVPFPSPPTYSRAVSAFSLHPVSCPPFRKLSYETQKEKKPLCVSPWPVWLSS